MTGCGQSNRARGDSFVAAFARASDAVAYEALMIAAGTGRSSASPTSWNSSPGIGADNGRRSHPPNSMSSGSSQRAFRTRTSQPGSSSHRAPCNRTYATSTTSSASPRACSWRKSRPVTEVRGAARRCRRKACAAAPVPQAESPSRPRTAQALRLSRPTAAHTGHRGRFEPTAAQARPRPGR